MAVRYEFRLAERLPPALAAAFPELTESRVASTRGSVLYGPVVDREHLQTLVNRFPAHGLTIVYLRQLPD